MYKQLDIFSFLEPQEEQLKPGEWVEKDLLGRKLSFNEIAQNIGNLIIMDKSTSSHEWYKVVLVEKITSYEGRRRLIYFDGCKQRGLVDEMWFDETLIYPARAYAIRKENEKC